jgi:uncharacterized protein with von Willebrand factor type A (vWA) domain
MSRAWRAYRRMTRTGPPAEFDVEATIRRAHQQGVLDSPVLVPARTNQARALILVDVDGSMAPFVHISRALLDTARHAGLGRVDVYYFHDVPTGVVFRDQARIDPVPLEAATVPFVDAGVMFYSDAGAARGGFDAARLEHTGRVLRLLQRFTPALAWLNPVPCERWEGTTAGAIRDVYGVPMFPFDRSGLTAAVDVMRGRM